MYLRSGTILAITVNETSLNPNQDIMIMIMIMMAVAAVVVGHGDIVHDVVVVVWYVTMLVVVISHGGWTSQW
jgi:hypothetical protein